MIKKVTAVFLLLFTVFFSFAQGANAGSLPVPEPVFSEVPSSFLQPAGKGGRIERVDYSIDYHGSSYDKHAYVYIPNGYDESGPREYNIFYLMHGGSGSAETFFGGEGRSSLLKNMN